MGEACEQAAIGEDGLIIDPETFYITNHYLNYPAMLVRLSTVQPDDLRKLIEASWRRGAPAKLVAAYDNQT